jgi:hypothetical protein
METGTIRSWAKNEGDKIAEGINLFNNNVERINIFFVR